MSDSRTPPRPAPLSREDEVQSGPWYRQRRWLVAGAAAVVLAVTVLTDLPQNSTVAAQARGDSALIEQVNGLSETCRYAVRESFTIRHDELRPGFLSASDRRLAPSLLAQDQDACSFINDDVYNLSDTTVPPGRAGKVLQHMVNTVLIWTTSDALAAIEAIQTLWTDPHSRTASASLRRAERELSMDRATALAQWGRADRLLHAHLVRLALPRLPG